MSRPDAWTPPGGPLIRYRSFRNGDPPALAALWNRSLPAVGVVAPLSAHELDALVMGKLGFDPEGLIVAEDDGRVVAFAHAGFGPAQPEGPTHRPDTAMGTVAMLVVEPGRDDPELEHGLFEAAESYLKSRGTKVFYAGGSAPMDPFYAGIYGGSEFAGVLDAHHAFARAARLAGYEPCATSILMEADMRRPEPRDPRLVMLRRQLELKVVEDALPAGWWRSLAVGYFRPSAYTLADRRDGQAVASASTWEVAAGASPGDGRSRTALVDVQVEPSRRRRGYGRLLVDGVLREARRQQADAVCVQVAATNLPAVGLYRRLGFEAVATSTLYRKPGGGSG